MSPAVIGLLGLICLLSFMALGMPIAFAFLLASGLGIMFLSGVDIALSSLGRIPFVWISDFTFACIPMFILMGFVVSRAGIATDLYTAAYKWLGRLPGGLSLATVAAAGGFAGISGSTMAGAATMASIAYPEMKKYRYDPGLAAGSIAGGATLGIMIPPSLGFILYGIITETSIGKLFMAGVIPGILEILLYFVAITVVVRLRPHFAPPLPSPISLKEKLTSLRPVWTMMVLFIVVMGSIYFGICTPTEAGGIGAGGAVIIAFASRRLSVRDLIQCLGKTMDITIMTFLLLIGAMVFNVFLALSGLPMVVSDGLTNLGLPYPALIAVILAVYIPLGMFMECVSMFVLTIPIFLTTFTEAGVNLIWMGVMMVRLCEIAQITPPVGLSVYVVQGVIKDIPVERVFKGVVPFLVADIILLVILFTVPQLSLFLPNLMSG